MNYYLIGQFSEILPCNIVSQHAIFHEVRSMSRQVTFDLDFLWNEVIVHELFENIFHGFSFKMPSETITDVNHNFSSSCKGIIFSKLFYAKIKNNLDSHANYG